MKQVMCCVKDLGFSYKSGSKILDKISFELGIGECLAVLGASGCGKSTLAKILAGFAKEDEGSIYWHNPDQLDPWFLKQMVFQDPSSALTPFYTPYKMLKELLKLHLHFDQTVIDLRIKALMDEVGLKHELLHKKISKLSGGEKQRLVLARSLVLDPQVLILDEPLSSCDPLLQKEILDLLKRKIKERSLTVIIILHDLEQASYIADKVLLLKDGTQELCESFDTFIKAPSTPYAEIFVSAFF